MERKLLNQNSVSFLGFSFHEKENASNNLVGSPLDDLTCIWISEMMHPVSLSQNPDDRETGYSNVLLNQRSAKDLPSCSIHQPVFALLAPQLNVTQELWRVTPALDWIIHCPRSIVMETEPCNHLRGSAHWHRQDLLVQISPQLQRMCLLSNTSPSVGFKVVSCTWFSYLINTMLLI